MQPFLQKVSLHIIQNYGENLGGLSIVLPNKRAGLFLKKYLAVQSGKTTWSPKIFSIDEFMTEIAGVIIPEPLTLLFDLYAVYKNTEGTDAQPPEEFLGWGSVLLNDFNEIDSYCADAGQLFNYLNEIKAIETWNPDGRGLTDFQKQYLAFWRSLGKLYFGFRESLCQKKQAYQGLAYRLAADKIKNQTTEVSDKNTQHLLFVGFNALTKAEEIVIRHFIGLGKAEILWDADRYYSENTNQEAGKFIRKNETDPGFFPPAKLSPGKKENKEFRWKCDDLETSEKEIEVIGVPGNVLQAKVAGNILAALFNTADFSPESANFQKTAVVLANESLLLPVLQSLPEKVKNVNITMGYPLKYSPLHDFWNSLFRLHENIVLFSEKRFFYYRDVVQVLSHPFLSFSEEFSALAVKSLAEIKQKNRIYFSAGELQKMAEESGRAEALKDILPLFSDWKNEPLAAISNLIRFVKFRISEKNMEAEFLASYLEIFHQIQSLPELQNVIQDIRTLRIIFNLVAESCSVPFSGEPLMGLQVMGMLETRTLDFENVILLSANEEVLPSGKSQNSFIPLDVKKQFGLPTYSDRDAIFAYHFYRLMQRAKKVSVLFNNDISSSSGMGGSEKSRFITQISEELQKKNPKINITEKIFSFPAIPTKGQALSIAKNESIIKRLDELAAKGFSPSAINTFLNCPLDFYFKYVIGIREENTVEETIDAATFGDLVHAALQDIYAPFAGNKVSAPDFEMRKNESAGIIRNAFLQKYSDRDINFGKNLLSLKVAEKFILSFLNNEITFLRHLASRGETMEILGLEKDMEAVIATHGRNIKFKGKADRIDRAGNTVRIIDYKTGTVDPAELKIESAEISGFSRLKPKAVQLLVYALLFRHPQPSSPKGNLISSGIVSIKKMSGGFMPLSISGIETIGQDQLVIFENELGKIIEKMYDLSIPFEHSADSKYCDFCGQG